MKKFILILFLILFLILCIVAPSHALFMRAFTSLTGEVEGSVDNATCTSLGDGTDDGTGIVLVSTGAVYFYFFDRSATDATSSPDYIRCRNYSTSGVWILQSFYVDSDGNVTISGTINEDSTARIGFLDTDAPGTDKDVGNIEVAYVDGADGAENADMYFRITQDGAENTVILQFDESDDQWETSKDIDSSAAIKAESIDAGIVWTLHGDGGTPYDLSASTICRHLYYMSSSATADVEVDLHSDPRCLGTDNTGRELEFFNFNTTYDYDIDPNGTDTIYLDTVSCGAGKKLILEAIGGYARIVGYSAGIWVVTNHNGASCEP